MVKRARAFRQGDLAEGMGLEVLRRLAFVALVPRPEDIGLDAMCTLARPERGIVLAERSFAVQIKAASVRGFPLSIERARWLHDFELPLFLLSVDLKQARAAVYSMVNLFAYS